MLQFISPALQGANFIGRVGIPLLQQAGIAAGMAGIGAGISGLTSKPKAKPQLTGRQKLSQAWGKIPGDLNSFQGGSFGYRKGTQPSYADSQGNVYDAVSGRLLYPGRTSTASTPGTGLTGGGISFGGSSVADRAYEAEKSRVAQLTAQDPEFQRYEAARKLAAAPSATTEQVQSAEDIGMQMWQKKYGDTPMGRPGGAIGQKNPLMDQFFGYQTGMSPQQMQAMQATASPVQVAPGEVPYQQGDLSRATLETGYDPAQYGLSPNLVQEMKERLMKQAKK